MYHCFVYACMCLWFSLGTKFKASLAQWVETFWYIWCVDNICLCLSSYALYSCFIIYIFCSCIIFYDEPYMIFCFILSSNLISAYTINFTGEFLIVLHFCTCHSLPIHYLRAWNNSGNYLRGKCRSRHAIFSINISLHSHVTWISRVEYISVPVQISKHDEHFSTYLPGENAKPLCISILIIFSLNILHTKTKCTRRLYKLVIICHL